MKLIKVLSLFFGTFIIILAFFFGGITLGEGYNIFNPYGDTQFANDYTPEKFTKIKIGMTRGEIKQIIGEPLRSHYYDKENVTIENYTSDGKLLGRTGFHLPLSADNAWFGSSVNYNSDSIAVKVYSGWYYD